MNIFSLVDSPNSPIHLSTQNYEKNTAKIWPDVQEINGATKYFALCPQCHNPVSLVNPFYQITESGLFYAKHVKHDVTGIALYNEEKYRSCPLHNPVRFDSQQKREPGTVSNEIKNIFHQHTEVIFRVAEMTSGIDFSYSVKESMMKSFGHDEGYRYRAIHKFNLPVGFLYMTNGQDIYGCYAKNIEIIKSINKSHNFQIGDKGYIFRRNKNYKTRLILFFSEHKFPSQNTDNKETIMLNIAEKTGTGTDDKKIIHREIIEYTNDFFHNWIAKKTTLNKLALQYIK